MTSYKNIMEKIERDAKEAYAGVDMVNSPPHYNEAGIEFSTHGGDFEIKKNNIPKKILTPQVGDLVMSPSSLYHKTIPFESDEERVCIAFDIIKID